MAGTKMARVFKLSTQYSAQMSVHTEIKGQGLPFLLETLCKSSKAKLCQISVCLHKKAWVGLSAVEW